MKILPHLLKEMIADCLRAKINPLSRQLSGLAQACWESGRELPALGLTKLFEENGEAYHRWNSALPGYVKPHKEVPLSFTSTGDLRDSFARAIACRDQLRAEMIARQEEMDWLVYVAYGLLLAGDPSARVEEEPAPLDQAQRPFRLWAAAASDFASAVKLIPADWPKPRRELWQARLAAIRDNEHIRRIEQPVAERSTRLRCRVHRRLRLVAVRKGRVVV